MLKKAVSKAAASEEPEAYPLGRTVRRISRTKSVRAAEWRGGRVPVEDLSDVRTKLADFFSILLDGGIGKTQG